MSTPTSPQDVWEQSHRVEAGQLIPPGTHVIYETRRLLYVEEAHEEAVRTLAQLPDPLPDWVDAPAILTDCACEVKSLHAPSRIGWWKCVSCGDEKHWTSLEYAIGLRPSKPGSLLGGNPV